MYFEVEFILDYPVLQVAVEPISLLDEKDWQAGFHLRNVNHVAEAGAARMLHCFDVGGAAAVGAGNHHGFTHRTHNVKAAATWNAGARDYDRISERIADAIEHCVLRLAPRSGERVLDVRTGTGWAARRIAARGSTVVGIDLGPDLIEAAKNLASEARLKVDFRVGDAEKLTFGDQTFDVVISTFGVMFVSQPERAAAELARVCRTDDRLGLVTWSLTLPSRKCFKPLHARYRRRPLRPHPHWSGAEGV